MSLRLWILERHTPAALRRRMLQLLVRATAGAFGVPPPVVPDAGRGDFVRAFGPFTRMASERAAAAGPEADAVRDRLYAGAHGIGVSIRRWAGVRTPEEAVRALRLVYRAIGIDLDADMHTGKVTVRRCAFSEFYTPAVCQFVSALDAGLFHGITRRWTVAFDARLTEGAASCDGRPHGGHAAMMRILVIGSGAGGSTVARELAGRYDVTVIEAGRPFLPFRQNLVLLARARRTGLFFDERMFGPLFPAMRARKTRGSGGDGLVLVNGRAFGGTTTISAGNALRCDEDLKACGIDLDAEFAELAREVPISRDHRSRWTPTTRKLEAACRELGLDPRPLPKLGDYSRCGRCGRCVLGCPTGAKWDARRFLADAVSRGADVESGLTVESLAWKGGRVVGVHARRGPWRSTVLADIVVLAAGGLGTPEILERSGIACEPRLFVDPVLCVAAPFPDARADHEISMPFVVERDRYIVSPYMDWLSFFFDRRWRMEAGQMIPLMVKLADDDVGRVRAGGIEKTLTTADRARLAEGASLCSDILERMGAPRATHVLGTLNAGHPGGALPAGSRPDPFHDDRLPDNVWAADASLIPRALGRPPILTIMALAKRVARSIAGREGGRAALPPSSIPG